MSILIEKPDKPLGYMNLERYEDEQNELLTEKERHLIKVQDKAVGSKYAFELLHLLNEPESIGLVTDIEKHVHDASPRMKAGMEAELLHAGLIEIVDGVTTITKRGRIISNIMTPKVLARFSKDVE